MPQFDLTKFPTQIFWLVVCFAVLYFLMAKAVLPKIGATIESREHKIQADLDAAQKANDAARAAGVEQDKALAEARGQASGLIREAAEAAAAQTSAKLHEVSDRLGADIVAAEKRIGEQRTRPSRVSAACRPKSPRPCWASWWDPPIPRRSPAPSTRQQRQASHDRYRMGSRCTRRRRRLVLRSDVLGGRFLRHLPGDRRQAARRRSDQALDDRTALIARTLGEAEKLRNEAQKARDEAQKSLTDSAKLAQEIVAQAKQEAVRLAQHAAEEREALIGRREQQAKDRIAQAEAQASREVRNMAVDVALAATRTLLKEQVGSGRTQAMIDEAIAELPRRLH